MKLISRAYTALTFTECTACESSVFVFTDTPFAGIFWIAMCFPSQTPCVLRM
jgi:hypothetical protein